MSLLLRIFSFGYNRSGVPSDDREHAGGFIFDCRALPNPGREERYALLTGLDKDVIDYFENIPETREFMQHVSALVRASVRQYRSRGFTDLMVAFGCTGGQHRSVYCAERLAHELREEGVRIELRHLERDRWP